MTVTISPPMPSPRIDSLRRAARWLGPAALLALTPKCALCLLAYAGLGATLGLGGPELCGGSTGSLTPWASALVWFGVSAALVTCGFLARGRGQRSRD